MSNGIILNIIPMLHTNTGIVITVGQTCSIHQSLLAFMTGLSYKGKIYTNIEDEEPMSEIEMYKTGRSNAVVGYGCGINRMNYISGHITWTPTTMKEYFAVQNCSESPTVALEPMPVLYRKGGDIPLFNLNTKAVEYFRRVRDIELFVNKAKLFSWAGIKNIKTSIKMLKELNDCYIGWNTGITNMNIMHSDDTKIKKYYKFTSGWNKDDKLGMLNSRFINFL